MTAYVLISPINRAQLIDDYMNLARAQMTSYSNALALTRYLVNEADYTPWAAASNNVDFIDRMLYDTSAAFECRTYASTLVSAVYAKVGFEPNENDLPMTIYALSIAVDWACNQLGIEDCVQRASNPYHLWMNDPANVDVSSDLRRIISCTAVTYGGPAEYAFIFKK